MLEDNFPTGRPTLEDVGVTFTSEVAAFELMKLRILNGGHAAIAYPAALMGIHFVHDAVADPLVRGFLDKLEAEEIIPHVPPVPGVDLKAYYRTIAQRFANPDVGDTIPRLCAGRLQPAAEIHPALDPRPAEGRRRRDGAGARIRFVVPLLRGTTDTGDVVRLDDPSAARLVPLALAAKDDPAKFLGLRDIFGDVADAQPFRAHFEAALNSLWTHGTRATLQRYLNGERLYCAGLTRLASMLPRLYLLPVGRGRAQRRGTGLSE